MFSQSMQVYQTANFVLLLDKFPEYMSVYRYHPDISSLSENIYEGAH